MKLHLLMYIFNIASDIRNFIRNYTRNKKCKLVFYSSDVIEKISLSVEMIIEMIYGKSKEVDLFTKKKYLLLLLEIVRLGFKFRELKFLNSLGFEFYIEKQVYLQSILEISEQDYENKLETLNEDNFLHIKNKTSKKIMLSTDKIDIPNKVIQLINKEHKEQVEEKESVKSLIFKNIKEYFEFLKNYIVKNGNFIEILYILRPLIYLSSMIIFKKKSFVPLIINMILDFIILKFERKEKTFENQRAYFYEYTYRLGRLSVYLLRNPIFSFFTKPFVRKLMKILRLPDFITNIVMLLLSYYTNIYYIL